MFKELFELADKIRPDARFFRLIVLIIIFGVIISRLPWIERLMARAIDVPDLRHSINHHSVDGKDVITVQAINSGYAKADNVFFRFYSLNGKIESFSVNSEDVYEIHQLDPDNGILILSLTRLAPGAKIEVGVWGRFNPDQTYISITSDQGSSVTGELPTLPNLKEDIGPVIAVFVKSWEIIREKINIKKEKVIEFGTQTLGIEGFNDLILFLERDDFKTIVSAVALLSLSIGVFFPHLAWLIPIIAAVGIALIADFQISLGFIVASILVLLLPPAAAALLSAIQDLGTETSRNSVEIVFGFLSVLLLIAIYSWKSMASARLLAIPTMILTAYLLRIISAIIPKERSEGPKLMEQPLSYQARAELENLTSLVAQVANRLEAVEVQLSQQQASIDSLSQKYTAVMKALRKAVTSQEGHSSQETGGAP